MSDDELNHWLSQLNAVSGWSVYQVGEDPPPPLVAVCRKHFFTDVVIIHSATTAVAYRTFAADAEQPPDAADAVWTYSGDADSALAAIFALSRPGKLQRKRWTPPSYQLPDGELRDITDQNGDAPR
jgi:hypothetical protein